MKERRLLLAIRTAPVAAVAACAWAEAWSQHGSVLTGDWGVFGGLVALVAAVVLSCGRPQRPTRAILIGFAALVALAAWQFATARWAPSGAGARDEAMLTLLYAVALVLPGLVLQTAADRLWATAILVLSATTLLVATTVRLLSTGDTSLLFAGGRLSSPTSYTNADAAMFMLGVWPALALAARRTLGIAARAVALGAAALLLGGGLATQSKGGALGLVVSAAFVLGASRARLRLLLPALLAAGCALAALGPLTAPYRASPGAFDASVHRAAVVLFGVAAGAIAVGALYAALDRRWEVPDRVRARIGFAVLAAAAIGLAAPVAAFFALSAHPGRTLSQRWQDFKHYSAHDRGTRTHLTAVGSNRYDFYRVSLGEVSKHPIVGDGAGGFAAAYLLHGRSPETPKRPHSLLLEVLSEDGAIGLMLLLAGIGAPLAALVRLARRPSAAAALGGTTCWLAQAAVDWTWSFPAAGIPFALLLGIGASADGPPLGRRLALAAGAAAALLAVLVFLPPWLSARYTDAARSHPSSAAGDLRWARRLDPLSVDPYVAEYQTTGSTKPLVAALAKEPRSVLLHYLLGVAKMREGRRRAALAEFEKALALYPSSPLLKLMIRRAR